MVEHPKTRVLIACGAAAWLSVGASRASGQSFQLIDRPPGAIVAYAQGVSYSGGVVAGSSIGSGIPDPGWYWTPAGGRTDIVGPGLPLNTGAFGISGNGNVLVGETSDGLVNTPAIAYRYDRTTGAMTSLGVEPGGDRSRALAASETGSVVVGYSALDQTLSQTLAFRWTQAGGLQSLGFARPGHHHSEALGVSADGSRVVGLSYGGDESDAFVWTSTTGMTSLPTLPGAVTTLANAINADGNIIVGAADNNAVMWVNGQISDLGLAPGYALSYARAVSEDGSVVVGQVLNGQPSSVTAGIWSAGSGWQPLESYLLSIGVTLPSGVDLRNATSISRDGRIIVGYTSTSPVQGFVVTIPTPASFLVLALVPLASRRRRGVMLV